LVISIIGIAYKSRRTLNEAAATIVNTRATLQCRTMV
jgi:hypothetical protein